jgi:hypothetical protein|tara:strand:- start:243 stop:644 length:402 start_codon:yes stop_codon:yes gene_type:complete
MSEKSDSVKYAWWIEDEKIALVYADVTNTQDSYSSPSIVKEITVKGIFTPDKFVPAENSNTIGEAGMTEKCTLPDEFHEAIIAKAVQKGYETKIDKIQMAQYFERQFEKSIREAKKKANTGGLAQAVVKLTDY